MKKVLLVLLVGLFWCNVGFAKPPFKNLLINENIITESDPTTFKELKYKKIKKIKGIDERTLKSGAKDFYAKYKAHVFTAIYEDNDPINIQVNYEIKSKEAAEGQAYKFSKAFGQLPKFLRKDIKIITIHEGHNRARAWNKEISVFTNAYGEDIEELLIHEAAHITIDWDKKNKTVGLLNFSNKWKSLQAKDNEYISEYASYIIRNKWRLEDVPESILAWYYVRCKSDRISKENYNKIIKAIPNRLKYFDQQNYDMHPVVCK